MASSAVRRVALIVKQSLTPKHSYGLQLAGVGPVPAMKPMPSASELMEKASEVLKRNTWLAVPKKKVPTVILCYISLLLLLCVYVYVYVYVLCASAKVPTVYSRNAGPDLDVEIIFTYSYASERSKQKSSERATLLPLP